MYLVFCGLDNAINFGWGKEKESATTKMVVVKLSKNGCHYITHWKRGLILVIAIGTIFCRYVPGCILQ